MKHTPDFRQTSRVARPCKAKDELQAKDELPTRDHEKSAPLLEL
jgi:hypothetical protein